ncbi:MAG TPA: polysaccharide biosynthesis C-terminal domain-containing protein, partial [Candidatus Polarisedimenticolaceae bacterium]|nr:polysaccharide biosynthesis C-terminal domain-containing protein [Candidatus Polarisedimenticolaceae bacterium]
FGAQVVSIVLALAGSVIVARTLGPNGKGVLAVFGLVLQTAAAFGTFGTAFALTFLAGKRRHRPAQLFGASLVLAGLLWLPAAALAAVVEDWALATALTGLSPEAYRLAVALVGPAYAVLLFQAILLGEGRVERVALISTESAAVTTAILLWALIVADRGLDGAIAASAAGTVYAMVRLGAVLARAHGIGFADTRAILRFAVPFGLKGYVGSLASHAWLRADVYLLNALAGPAAVGQYSIATNMAERIWMLEGAIVQSAAPEVIRRDHDRAAELTGRVARHLLVLSVLAAAALAAVSPWIVPLFFGEAFRPAIVPLLILLPGVVALSVARVFSGYYSGQLGRPSTVSLVAGVTALIALGLYVLVIPRWGLNGAAIASTAAYAVPLAIYLFIVPRATGIPVARLLVLSGGDVRELVARTRRLFHPSG